MSKCGIPDTHCVDLCMEELKGSLASSYKWISWSVYRGLPPRAIHVGYKKDGSPVYIGRVSHEGSAALVKIVPSKEFACIHVNGQEIIKKYFEVLCGYGFQWVRSGEGHVPGGAVLCGESTTKGSLYIGRAHHEGRLIPGIVYPQRGCLVIPFNGKEITYLHYDVLVNQEKVTQIEERKWVRAGYKRPVPSGAVCAGYDSDGTTIYIGRVNHEGNLLPAKVIPEKALVHTQHKGNEIAKKSYEALCDADVSWKPFKGVIPPNAVSCGSLVSGEPVYIGRGKYNGSLTPGKVLASTKVLQIPYGWNEVTIYDFEMLVQGEDGMVSSDDDADDFAPHDPVIKPLKSNQRLKWVPGKNNQPPPEGAVLAGHDSDGSPIYVGRVLYEGNQIPAKIIPRKDLCHTQFNGEEIEMSSYEALCHGNVEWIEFKDNIPSNAIVCGHTVSGEAVYVGRGRYLGSLTPGRVMARQRQLYIPMNWSEMRIAKFEILVNMSFDTKDIRGTLNWIHTKREQPAPAGAVCAGKEADGSKIYVGRVQHDGNRFVGKVIPNKKVCYTTDGGNVISKLSYEALCNETVTWMPFCGTIPVLAVECGRARDGEMVYIGRSRYKSAHIPGTVLESEKKLRIAYEMEEIICDDFEILVLSQDDPIECAGSNCSSETDVLHNKIE